jgi:hypothetical protein
MGEVLVFFKGDFMANDSRASFGGSFLEEQQQEEQKKPQPWEVAIRTAVSGFRDFVKSFQRDPVQALVKESKQIVKDIEGIPGFFQGLAKDVMGVIQENNQRLAEREARINYVNIMMDFEKKPGIMAPSVVDRFNTLSESQSPEDKNLAQEMLDQVYKNPELGAVFNRAFAENALREDPRVMGELYVDCLNSNDPFDQEYAQTIEAAAFRAGGETLKEFNAGREQAYEAQAMEIMAARQGLAMAG